MNRLQNAETELAKRVANHCAPVMTGVKISNMITVDAEEAGILCHICRNTLLNAECLYENGQKSVVLLFHSAEVQQYIWSNHRFMHGLGYDNLNLEYILKEVRRRFHDYMDNQEEFPHELGILLGYPIWDVIGFIANKGDNCLYAGYWKVYCELSRAILTFSKYDRAKRELAGRISRGQTLEHIISCYHNKRV